MKKSIKYAVLPALTLALLGAGVVSAQTTNTPGATASVHKVGRAMHGGGGGFMMFMGGDSEEFAERQALMFSEHSELTGISLDEIKQAWAEGKELPELLKEKGIDPETVREKMQAKAEEKMKEQIQSLVEKGVITQAQADTRIEFMKNNKPEFHKMKPGMMQRFEKRLDTATESGTATNS